MKHISYIGSALVFLSLAFAFYEAWLWGGYWHMVFAGMVLGSTALAVPLLFAIKLHSMWVIDHRETPVLSPPKRTRKRNTEE